MRRTGCGLFLLIATWGLSTRLTANCGCNWSVPCAKHQRQRAARASIFTPRTSCRLMVRGWAKFDYDGVEYLGRGRRLHSPASRKSSTISTTGRTIWGSWRSSLPGDFATTEITPPAPASG